LTASNRHMSRNILELIRNVHEMFFTLRCKPLFFFQLPAEIQDDLQWDLKKTQKYYEHKDENKSSEKYYEKIEKYSEHKKRTKIQ
jgi:hypothetical protein